IPGNCSSSWSKFWKHRVKSSPPAYSRNSLRISSSFGPDWMWVNRISSFISHEEYRVDDEPKSGGNIILYDHCSVDPVMSFVPTTSGVFLDPLRVLSLQTLPY